MYILVVIVNIKHICIDIPIGAQLVCHEISKAKIFTSKLIRLSQIM